MTPLSLARDIVSMIDLSKFSRILEPSCGDGSFLSAIFRQLIEGGHSSSNTGAVEVVGIEIDRILADKSREIVEGFNLTRSCEVRGTVFHADFFYAYMARRVSSQAKDTTALLTPGSFDLIVGNPPFGGTFDHAIEDTLDRLLGKRLGMKIKKETYAFFIVACMDLLRPGGLLSFVCSDTLLTIPTMTGLRRVLMESGEVSIRDVDGFSSETTYPVFVLEFRKSGRRRHVSRNSTVINIDTVYSIPNLSWGVTPDLARLFAGPLLRDFFVASSGMTTGKNEFFVRRVDDGQRIVEPYRFEFYHARITVDYELRRARLGRISERRLRLLERAEAAGAVERRLRVVPRDIPLTIQLPDPRYRPYNKANGRLIFSKPTHYIYWENGGEAVLTYKKTGNWYLRGVGGQPYFGREGLTWQLVAARFIARYIPPGYILDSGAPCAFLRSEVDRHELALILGWLLSGLANRTLKTVINHTRNIQSKDFERMPYPWWLSERDRSAIVSHVNLMIAEARNGRTWLPKDRMILQLDDLFEFREHANPRHSHSMRSVLENGTDNFVLTAQ